MKGKGERTIQQAVLREALMGRLGGKKSGCEMDMMVAIGRGSNDIFFLLPPSKNERTAAFPSILLTVTLDERVCVRVCQGAGIAQFASGYFFLLIVS